MRFDLDPNSLSVGEMADLADVAGPGIVEELAQGRTSPRALLGLVWILGRRTNPAFTLDSARDVKISDLQLAAANGNGNGAAPTTGEDDDGETHDQN